MKLSCLKIILKRRFGTTKRQSCKSAELREFRYFNNKRHDNSPFLSLKTSDEVLQKIEDFKQNGKLTCANFSQAIQSLAFMREFELCWGLFRNVKSYNKSLKYQATNKYDTRNFVLDVSGYTTMIWLCVHQRQCNELSQQMSIDKVFQLYNDMLNNDIKSDSYIITAIMSACCKLNEYDKGISFMNDIKNSNDVNIVFDTSIYNGIINLYVSKSDMINGMIHYEEMIKNKITCDDVTYATLINGCNKINDIKNAEWLFRQSLDNNMTNQYIYGAILNVYANIGDVKQCWNIIIEMINKYTDTNDIRYKPDSVCFSILLKSIIKNCQKNNETSINVQNGWKIIKYCILKMNQLNVNKSHGIYGTLFQLCGGTFGKDNCRFDIALKFYDKMLKSDMIPSEVCYHNLLKCGIYHFKYASNKQNIKLKYNIRNISQLIGWIKKEMNIFNVPISRHIRQTIDRC